MTDLANVSKLIGKLKTITHILEENRIIPVHQQVNQFYYMQKASELTMLHEQLTMVIEKQASLHKLIDTIYPEVFDRWQKDIRWLNLNLPELVAQPINTQTKQLTNT